MGTIQKHEQKILELSLCKIENSKHPENKKTHGKSSLLHRSLMVNSVLRKVRLEQNKLPELLMDYREPKPIDMDQEELQDCFNAEMPHLPRLTQTNRTCHPLPISRQTTIKSAVTNNSSHSESLLVSSSQNTSESNRDNPCISTSCQSDPNNQQPCKPPEESSSRSQCQKRKLTITDRTNPEIPASPSKKAKNTLIAVHSNSTTNSSFYNFQSHDVSSFDVVSEKSSDTAGVTSLATLFNGLGAQTESDTVKLNFSNSYYTAMLAF